MVSPPGSGRPVEILDSMNVVELDVGTGRFRAAFDRDRDPASMAVVAVIAVATQRDPLDLSPLHAAIDASALDELFSRAVEGVQPAVSFRYEGFEVTVFDEGTIEARPEETG